jgi:hypothetical protein
MSIVFFSEVKKIEKKTRLIRAWKAPGKDDIKTETKDMGWYILLEGSWEYLYIGDLPPEDLAVGDKVLVTIEKATS